MMKYAIKVKFDDEWVYVTEIDQHDLTLPKTYDTKEEAEEHAKVWKEHVVVEYQEEKRLQDKKKQIKEDLYDLVKEDMFKASSALEGLTPEQALDEMVDHAEKHGLYDLSMPPENNITPDAWVIIEISTPVGNSSYTKVLAGWHGSYLYGDSWRMSSAIKTIDMNIDEDFFIVKTDSGSIYKLYKNNQGLRMSNLGIYNELKEKHQDLIQIVDL